MAHIWKDEDTKVTHIRIENADVTLCGILEGWTRLGDEPIKPKWGVSCEDCQNELEDLRDIKK